MLNLSLSVFNSRCSVTARNNGDYATFVLIFLPTDDCLATNLWWQLTLNYQSQSYFTTGGLRSFNSSWRQAPWGSLLEIYFLQMNHCGHRPYVTSLTRGGVYILRIGFAFVKCTYSIGLHGYGERLSFPGSTQSDKSDNLEVSTSHRLWDVSLRAEPHPYASLEAVY
jgi:hypothetical protein